MGLLDALTGGGKRKERVQDMLANGARVIDVRTPGEFMGGHVAGSTNIPLNEVSRRFQEIERMQPVVLCCASGMRSGQAARSLKAKGIDCENGGSWVRVNGLLG